MAVTNERRNEPNHYIVCEFVHKSVNLNKISTRFNEFVHVLCNVRFAETI